MRQIDRDFFRGMVAERAESIRAEGTATALRDVTDAYSRTKAAVNKWGATSTGSRAMTMHWLIEIAALSELAAVDFILPECSTRNKVDALTNGPRGATGSTKEKV